MCPPTGAAFCQIMDATFPGKVPLQRVNFNASLSYEITQNYKILQQVFARCHVQKNIDVDQLQRGTFQDNLEFLQWIKHYHDVNTVLHPGEYKAHERRRQCGCAEPKCAPGKFGAKRPISTSLSASTSSGGAASLAAKKARTASASVHITTTRPHSSTTSTSASASMARGAACSVSAARGTARGTGAPAVRAVREQVSAEDAEELRRVAEGACEGVTVQQFADLKFSLESMEKERDFYYGKLRAVEDLCQEVLAQQSEAEDAGDAASPLTAFVNKVISVLFVLGFTHSGVVFARKEMLSHHVFWFLKHAHHAQVQEG